MKRAILFLAIVLTAVTAVAARNEKSGTFTTSDGVKLHYIEAGKGPAILFIPGWTMPAEIWRPQINHFAQNYRVIAVDPRSQGDSDKRADGNYPARRSRDYKELAEALRLSPVVLVGWSMGVHEILAYAEQFGTAEVRGVVLVDGMLWEKYEPHMAAQIYNWMQEMQTDRRKATQEFVRSMYKRPQRPEYLEEVATASLKTPTNTAVTLIFNMFRDNWIPALQHLNCPVLFAYTPQLNEAAALLKSHVPGARLEIFEKAGHALFVDEAERFNHSLDDFLRNLPTK